MQIFVSSLFCAHAHNFMFTVLKSFVWIHINNFIIKGYMVYLIARNVLSLFESTVLYLIMLYFIYIFIPFHSVMLCYVMLYYIIYSLLHHVQTGSGAHPASYSVGTGGSFLGINRPGREADHSSPPSAEVKNSWCYTSTPPIRLHGVVLS
jgi:hypothetical protein